MAFLFSFIVKKFQQKVSFFSYIHPPPSLPVIVNNWRQGRCGQGELSGDQIFKVRLVRVQGENAFFEIHHRADPRHASGGVLSSMDS